MRGAAFAIVLLACSSDEPPSDFTALVSAPSSPDVVYAAAGSVASFRALHRSDDGGRTYRIVSRHFESPLRHDREGNAQNVVVSADNPDLLLLMSQGGWIFRSDDGGANWARTPADIRDRFGEVWAHPRRGGVFFASGIAFLRSEDGGRSWVDLEPADPACLDPFIVDLAFDAADDDRVYGAAGSMGVLVSDDGGDCFRPASPLEAERLLADDGGLYAVAPDGVYVSRDGAQSFVHIADWSVVEAMPGGDGALERGIGPTALARVGDVLMIGTKRLHVIGVDLESGGVFDAGAGLIRRGHQVNALVYHEPSARLLAGVDATCRGYGGVYESVDLGRTWSETELESTPYAPGGSAIEPYVEHEVLVIFFRDVTDARRNAIFEEHGVAEVRPLSGAFYTLRFDDDRDVPALLAELDLVPEIDCAMPNLVFRP